MTLNLETCTLIDVIREGIDTNVIEVINNCREARQVHQRFADNTPHEGGRKVALNMVDNLDRAIAYLQKNWRTHCIEYARINVGFRVQLASACAKVAGVDVNVLLDIAGRPIGEGA